MLTVRDFASTYNPPNASGGMALWRDYYGVLGFYQAHPNASTPDAMRAFDLSKARVSGWRGDTTPDVVTGYETALEHGWFTGDADTATGRALAQLTIAIFACGSISDTYTPRWATDSSLADGEIWDALSRIGLQPRREHLEGNRAQEISAAEGSSALGRTLVAIGAPQGGKTAETVPPLPDAILEAGEKTRRACAELYLAERATVYDDKDTLQIQTRNRSEAFRESVATLLRSLTDEPITVGTNVTVSADAARDLRTA